MKSIALAVLALAMIIGLALFWPFAKNEFAAHQVRHTIKFEARLTVYDPRTKEFGPVQITTAQRQRLLKVLDFDYFILGRSARGVPSCLSMEKLEFESLENGHEATISTSPDCGTFSYNGKVHAWGWSNEAKGELAALRKELFPKVERSE